MFDDGGMVGHVLSSVVHRVAEAASMGALHNIRGTGGVVAHKAVVFQECHDIFLDRLHDFVGAWAVGTGQFPYRGA
eukprot:525052-Prymnesium_polylepis.1